MVASKLVIAFVSNFGVAKNNDATAATNADQKHATDSKKSL